ncbi:septal ring lytic transglycosylase RlpA family lipoprotein [Aestuariivirga litoralis]|uniref:Endolytic peptidoglycan transglycosylase RlpA n=1 Tax=Aestuariivirga litoralis TaxID=2650924 RepID=A0A2W2ANK1_9HYPH|nr:septal ring lytic transglycosylase RlpA family protein [Aestuariivirga litoralis]PZF76971.1 septal ring lytic transglycosylase RlpA family lipoprotein [Aestuariivirga litoralis]
MLRHARKAIVLAAIGLAIAGCSSHKKQAKQDPFAGVGSPIYPGSGPVPWGGGRYHVGKPYQVAGVWFTPKEQPNYDRKGTASWYGEDFNRRKTSNGEWFDMNRLTAAHATLPLPSYAKVTNLENGREVVVRINDRGPFVDTRVMDLSKAAASELGYLNQGTAKVRVQYIGPAPLNDKGGRHLVAMNTELERGTPMRKMIAAADHRRGKSAPAETVMVAEAAPVKKKQAPKVVAETVAFEQPAEPVQAAPGPTGEVSYYIQLGSFSDGGNAARARDQFASVWPVQFIELSGAAGPVYRVRLGPISDNDDAQTALSDARSAGFTDARLIKSEAVQAALQ